MDTRTEPIRQDLDTLRDSMTNKMSQIESKIKGTVDDTTETLKRNLDVKHQVSEHPWTMLGIATLAGYVLGNMGGSRSDSSTYRNDFRHRDLHSGEAVRYYGEAETRSQKSQDTNDSTSSSSRNENSSRNDYDDRNQQQSSSSGFVDDVMSQLGTELDTLKTAAVSSLVNLLRDTVKQNLPGVYDEAERLRNGSSSSNSAST